MQRNGRRERYCPSAGLPSPCLRCPQVDGVVGGCATWVSTTKQLQRQYPSPLMVQYAVRGLSAYVNSSAHPSWCALFWPAQYPPFRGPPLPLMRVVGRFSVGRLASQLSPPGRRYP